MPLKDDFYKDITHNLIDFIVCLPTQQVYLGHFGPVGSALPEVLLTPLTILYPLPVANVTNI